MTATIEHIRATARLVCALDTRDDALRATRAALDRVQRHIAEHGTQPPASLADAAARATARLVRASCDALGEVVTVHRLGLAPLDAVMVALAGTAGDADQGAHTEGASGISDAVRADLRAAVSDAARALLFAVEALAAHAGDEDAPAEGEPADVRVLFHVDGGLPC